MSKSTFKKVMLRAGSNFEAPQGDVPVTKERLAHWVNTHRRMTANGQVVPMHWDHGTDPEMQKPITLSDYEARQSRSSRNSVGRLHSIELTPDGEAAELTYELRDPEAIRKMGANCMQVSPVLMKSHKDGGGNVYDDVITHLDLVNHPVDHTQGPAVQVDDSPAVVMSLRMGNETYTLATGAGNATPEQEQADDPQSPIGQLLRLLQQAYGLVLPPDTTAATLVDRLTTACTLKRHDSPLGDVDGAESGNRFGNTENDNLVLDPEIATMSLTKEQQAEFDALKAENARLKKHASQTIKMSLIAGLDALLEDGKITPAEHEHNKAKLETVTMSLGENGNVVGDENVSLFIASREQIPAKTFFDGSGKQQSETLELDPPESISMSANPFAPADPNQQTTNRKPTANEVEAAKNALLRK